MTDNPSVKIPLQIGNPPVPAAAVNAGPAIPVEASASGLPVSATGKIPFVTAVPAPLAESSSATEPDIPLSEAVIIGGSQIIDSEGDALQETVPSLDSLFPLPPPVVPSFSTLLDEMLASINDYDIISLKVQDPGWRLVFESLTPEQFGNIIAHVNMDHEQPRVALLLVPYVNGGNNSFTCAYCVAALRNTAEWNRAAMVEKLLPYCRDVAESHTLIRTELSEWEQMTTAQYFDVALRNQ